MMRIDVVIDGVFWERFTGLKFPPSANLLGRPSIFYFLKNIVLQFSSRFNTTVSFTCKRSSSLTKEIYMMRKKLYLFLSIFSKKYYLWNPFHSNHIILVSISFPSLDILKLPFPIWNSVILKETIEGALTSPKFLCYLGE